MKIDTSNPLTRWGIPILVSLSVTACGTGSSGTSVSSTPSSTTAVSSSAAAVSSAPVVSSSSSSPAVNLPLIVAINAGSTTATSYDGVQYQADKYANGGTTNSTSDPISGVTEDTLFQSERYGSYSYSIPVLAGTYTVELSMVEMYHEANGLRSFNLSVEGKVELASLDLYSQAGHDGAFNYTVANVRVTDGKLDITLEALEDQGTLSGFAVYSADGGIDTSVPEPEPSNCNGYVGITYDDGPTNTSAFVNALKQADLVPVTFFVNGSGIASHQGAIAQMLTVGEVQNHSFDHVDMGGYSYAQVKSQLERNNTAIQNAGAPKPTVFRPPYGTLNSTIRQAASDLGMISITWDVDSKDWDNASTSAIVSANSRLQNGQVILMHENQGASLAAIPQIATMLKGKGLCPGKLDPNTGRAVAP